MRMILTGLHENKEITLINPPIEFKNATFTNVKFKNPKRHPVHIDIGCVFENVTFDGELFTSNIYPDYITSIHPSTIINNVKFINDILSNHIFNTLLKLSKKEFVRVWTDTLNYLFNSTNPTYDDLLIQVTSESLNVDYVFKFIFSEVIDKPFSLDDWDLFVNTVKSKPLEIWLGEPILISDDENTVIKEMKQKLKKELQEDPLGVRYTTMTEEEIATKLEAEEYDFTEEKVIINKKKLAKLFGVRAAGKIMKKLKQAANTDEKYELILELLTDGIELNDEVTVSEIDQMVVDGILTTEQATILKNAGQKKINRLKHLGIHTRRIPRSIIKELKKELGG